MVYMTKRDYLQLPITTVWCTRGYQTVTAVELDGDEAILYTERGYSRMPLGMIRGITTTNGDRYIFPWSLV